VSQRYGAQRRILHAQGVSNTAKTETGHDWQEAGDAWGHAAADWSCLYEHYNTEVTLAVFTRTGIGPGVELLDVACGSGLVARLAASCGAQVSGIDAAEQLLAIARSRSPEADFRLGSMFDLPWDDASFDVVTSFNGIWGNCGDALVEMRRVLRPGGKAAITFFGNSAPLDRRATYLAMLPYLPPAEVDGLRSNNEIARPGVAEEMLEKAGFEVLERGGRVQTIEWPDDDIAWRAMRSTGPFMPALAHPDQEGLRRDILAALEPCRDQHGIYRFRNDQQFVIATTA
jgi:ubiquinone/menaquinone biosynthesis C-methylase UbiE